MFHHPKKLYPLLALLPSAAMAGKEYQFTKTFKFKEDFFLRFHPLPTAVGPNESVEVLMAALEDTAPRFKDVWIDEIESNLQGGKCTVDREKMRLPKFSICDWKYPDRYDVDELPTPGQCYDYENGFIQRIYYEIKKLEITCPEDFSYEDLDVDAYTKAVFSGDEFLEVINPPDDTSCDGDEPTPYDESPTCLFYEADTPRCTSCLFSDADTAEWSSFNKCTAELYINRFVDVPVYLKCLDTEGYGRVVANKLIDALDKYFELVVGPYLADEIMEQAPEGSIYNFASPYEGDRKYCTHGAYYANGNLLDQVPDEDGILITKFTYGFDVIWYKPKDFDEELLPDVEDTIAEAFKSGDFLRFLREEYPNLDLIQDDKCFCDVITRPGVTFPPSPRPTSEPTMLPTAEAVVLPETEAPTISPTEEDDGPYTPAPTCPRCIIHPDDKEEDECPIVTDGTCGDGKRGDGICPYDGYCCSKWGWCGTTKEYCDDDSVAPSPSGPVGAPPSPTYSIDAGQCAAGYVGDGFCADDNLCCSDWGYCGEGETYCFSTRRYDEESGEEDYDGTCGGGGIGDGKCSAELCCSRFGFCGEGELYCTGQNAVADDYVEEAQQIINSSPLPRDLKPEFGFRCGVTEVDARSNCKPKCTHHVQCDDGEECWGIQLNYCNTFEEGEHPVCTDLDEADEDSRCGYDEASARGHCGPKCTDNEECAEGEFCFPTLLNLCECHEETCPDSATTFFNAKALISPYFVLSENKQEGKPRNASSELNLSVAASLLLVLASMNALVM